MAAAIRQVVTVLLMSAKFVFGSLVAVAMVVVGGFLALSGMGYIGESDATSGSLSVTGSLLAGLGVALAITILQRRHPDGRGR